MVFKVYNKKGDIILPTSINIKCAIKLANFLNAPLEELPKLILIRRYNG